ncbi:hypothetical protein HYPSUDRAFT_72889 [Hypholoma sublateritium FD-334 SS-4]|uniref:Uncharacterized protein n=1 Tax=Hypholoma sublateritium (strain FD-334 SS-4) TaxID=945553 RepID=A0A0D2NZA0_HYPSF|nr:hypothetical protein HYPSUDRAFT_72889 [Hypholoma sublateritium FD-334 SS-4]
MFPTTAAQDDDHPMSTPLAVSTPPLTWHAPGPSTTSPTLLYVPRPMRGLLPVSPSFSALSSTPQTLFPILRIPTTTQLIAPDTPSTRIYTTDHLLSLRPAKPNETASDRAIEELLLTNADPIMLKSTPAVGQGRPRGNSLRTLRIQAANPDAMEDRAQPKASAAKFGRRRARGATLHQIQVPRPDAAAAAPRSAGLPYRGALPKFPTRQVDGSWRNARRAPASPSMRD